MTCSPVQEHIFYNLLPCCTFQVVKGTLPDPAVHMVLWAAATLTACGACKLSLRCRGGRNRMKGPAHQLELLAVDGFRGIDSPRTTLTGRRVGQSPDPGVGGRWNPTRKALWYIFKQSSTALFALLPGWCIHEVSISSQVFQRTKIVTSTVHCLDTKHWNLCSCSPDRGFAGPLNEVPTATASMLSVHMDCNCA